MHVTDFLKNPAVCDDVPAIALFGSERHLKQSALPKIVETILGAPGGDDDFGLVHLTGKDVDLRTVGDELRMISMWGDRRIIVVDDADDFVTKHRAGLEKYLDAPAKKSVLILDVKSWPKNTKLAKRIAKSGLDLECSELKGAALHRWLSDTAEERHDKKLSREAAALMVELAGSSLGLLDQELSKLASYVGDRDRITPEDVQILVGGWRAETTWTMLNAVRDRDMSTAFACLDKLLVAGEAPQKILGGINFVFRKLAHATEYSRHGMPLSAAIRKAGVFPSDTQPTDRYLRRVGRPHAERLYEVLLTADRNMKGGSRTSERLQLEQLLVELSGPAAVR